MKSASHAAARRFSSRRRFIESAFMTVCREHPVRSLVVALSAAVVIASCDGSFSGGDVSGTFRVSGVVRLGGVPVIGAKVAVLTQRPERDVLTDSDGRYTLVAHTRQPRGMSPLVSAHKDGYFTAIQFVDNQYVPIRANSTLDLTLERLVYVSIGQVVHGSSGGSPGVCSHWGYGTGPCERFAISTPSSGRLDIITAGVTSDIDVVGPDGTFEAHDTCGCDPRVIQIPVRAKSTYEIRVMRESTTFELTTALH